MKKIEKVANVLKNDYGTNCPFRLCKFLRIDIKYFDLGKIKGYYKNVDGNNYIVINETLSNFDKKIVCAHELGHFLLHGNEEIQFSITNNKFSKNKIYEKEANTFVLYLLLDDEINEYTYKTCLGLDFLEEIKKY